MDDKGDTVDLDRIPYQTMLRIIGRDLDQHRASLVRLLETPSGFAAQFTGNSQDAEVRDLTYSYEELNARAKGSKLQPLLRHPTGGAKRLKHGKPTYQDFFRALGYELEDAGAYSILLDELDDGYLLTYQFYNPDSGFMLHKHCAPLLADAAGTIVNVASMRRGRLLRKHGT